MSGKGENGRERKRQLLGKACQVWEKMPMGRGSRILLPSRVNPTVRQMLPSQQPWGSEVLLHRLGPKLTTPPCSEFKGAPRSPGLQIQVPGREYLITVTETPANECTCGKLFRGDGRDMPAPQRMEVLAPRR